MSASRVLGRVGDGLFAPRLIWARVLVLLLVSGVVSACVSPALDEEQYRAKALAAVDAASGEVASSQLVTGQYLRRRVFGPYADEVVTASETALGSVSQAFTAAQPPSRRSDPTYDEVAGALSDAQDAVSRTRIAVRRSDDAEMASALRQLRSVADDLAVLQEKLQ